MRRALLALGLALPLLAGTAMAQAQQQAPQSAETAQAVPNGAPTAQQQSQDRGPGPDKGAPEVQAPVPESQSAGENRQQQAPTSTATQQPTGTPTAPQPEVAPVPVSPIPAPPPVSERAQPSAEEQELEAALKGQHIQGRISIPNQSASLLVQPQGRDWRAFRNQTLFWTGAIAVLGMAAVIALFYLIRGRVRLEAGFSGRTMLRFGFIERVVHWMTASTFIVLALSGLNLTFGRHLIRPLIGDQPFTDLTHYGKIAHNFLAFPFTLGIVLMFLFWVKGNIPNKLDLVWLRQFGGMVGSGNPPSQQFNAGQKVIFWVTVLGGGLVALSGYLLLFPFTVAGVNGLQWSHMLHGTLSMLMIAVMLGHIYIGTLGIEGSFSAMGSGRVDYNWAREHHSLWVDDELRKAHDSVRPEAAARPAGAD
ncbi:formate dehydrogenase subunit gamma [Pseudoroseomonas rhizosphaerae]|uniref:Formate dehydrogenase subunit gamma n=1 Tax=Teichococcus rhizosphaerae TaxID=1335062 RepID=A0A2C7AAD7_9PROT|nr:formate dehydrogenase subunit gamma [Pseudoroseomonas rhizosphaerae]PHK94999.1 formate dehydrogenase subunit gamma [Pseudoroseomonas rhizosphaerae]